MLKHLLLACGLLFLGTQIGELQAQSEVSEHEEEELKGLTKVVDILTLKPNKKRAALDSTLYPSKLIFAPYILYSPETNVGFGIGGSFQFKLPNSGDEERTRTSTIPIAFTYTLENQLLFYSGFEVFSPDEEWVLSGNVRAQIFPRLFFGIGRDTDAENEEIFESTQIVVEPILTKQLFVEKLFLGGGFRYRNVSQTGFKKFDENDVSIPSRFIDAGINGSGGSISVGVEAAALYDTRNSLLNAQTGTFVEATYGTYGKALGGTNEFELVRYDVRKYFQLRGTEDWRDILAFNTQGYFSSGNVPLVELAQLGSGEIMRGYYEGRYTDRHLIAAQAEYRLNFENSNFGAVGFASAGDVNSKVNQFSLNQLRTAYGLGVRYMLDPLERLNLRVDFALTGEGDFNFYIQIGEAF
ncbi:MAG: BamA/TamA family outer membrane protein [Saprospiraceae bacterium]